MSKHIGIVACSYEGAALCYRTICKEGSQYLGEHAHPEISLHNHPLNEYMKFIISGNWERVARLMLSSSEKLFNTGLIKKSAPVLDSTRILARAALMHSVGE